MAHLRSPLEQLLYDKIRGLQGTESNRAFAKRLRMGREMWQKTTEGVPLGKTVLRAVVREYPLLQLLAAAYLVETLGNPNGRNGHATPSAEIAVPEKESPRELVEAAGG